MTGKAVHGKRLMVLFSGARSGSNYLVDILGKIPGAIALSEALNPKGVYGLNLYPEVEARLLRHFGSEDALWRAMRMTPFETLATLLEAAPADVPVVVKILPNQVHAKVLRRILQAHAVGAIFLTRRRLDQYISLRKAREGGEWFRADTTDLRPEVRCDAFLSWTTVLENWLAEMVAMCREAGIATAFLDYDRDLKNGTAQEISERICRRMAPLQLLAGPQDLAGESWFTRQDREEDPFAKIGNGDALRADLERLGCLDEARTTPDLEAAAQPVDSAPDLIASPDAGAALIQAGEFGRLQAAMARIGCDVAPGMFRPADLPRAEYGFRRFTFICGLHRSGTTILHDHVAARFDVASLRHGTVPRSEGQFLQEVLPQEEAFGGPGHFAFAPQMVPPPVRDRRRAADLASAICGTWAAHADRPDHPHLLEKSPTNLTRIAWLRSVFPEVRFIILVRDPRAVALATRKWRPAALELLLAHWQAAHLSALSQAGTDCHVLRYEDFCADPEAQLDRIGAFCGLEPRTTPGPQPRTAPDIRDSNDDYLPDWPNDLYFAPELKAWELFGYRF